MQFSVGTVAFPGAWVGAKLVGWAEEPWEDGTLGLQSEPKCSALLGLVIGSGNM